MLVPILAPMIMPIACDTFIMPAFTKPTTITVVADDDWIIAVTAVPSRMPFSGVLVSLYKISSSLLPAAFFSPSPIRDMPNRNRATPLNSDRTSVNPSICSFSFSSVRTLHQIVTCFYTSDIFYHTCPENGRKVHKKVMQK